MKYSRMVHGILDKYHILQLPDSDTKVNQGLNLSLADSQFPIMSVIISTTNALLFVSIININPDTWIHALEKNTGSYWVLQKHVARIVNIVPSGQPHRDTALVPLSIMIRNPNWDRVGGVSGVWGCESLSIPVSTMSDEISAWWMFKSFLPHFVNSVALSLSSAWLHDLMVCSTPGSWSSTLSQGLFKLMLIELVVLSNHSFDWRSWKPQGRNCRMLTKWTGTGSVGRNSEFLTPPWPSRMFH